MLKLNPFYDQRRKALTFVSITMTFGFIVFWLLLPFFMVLSDLVNYSFASDVLGRSPAFLKESFTHPIDTLDSYFAWFYHYVFYEPKHVKWASFFAWKIPLLPLLAYVIFSGFMIRANPYEYSPQIYGSGHAANPREVKKMGLFTGKYLYLGNYRGKPLHMTEPRSGVCVAAPNEGKTVGVVIPNILTADNACLFIHDPKGELAKLTSGYRATLGPTFIMDFTKFDKPKEGLFYACWNPIDTANMPPQHKGRDGYIDTVVDFLIPDGPEGTDPYWVKAGRACLIGLTLYITNKVTQAKANDYFLMRLSQNKMDKDDLDVLMSYYQSMQSTEMVKRAIDSIRNDSFTRRDYVPVGSWDPLPKNWIGFEASFGMLLDLLNNWMFTKTIELRKRREQGDMVAMSQDAWQIIFNAIVDETFFYGYSRRALLELNQVLSLPETQRASVISMAQTGIEIFKNTAIRNRTSSNDFTYDALRGMKNPKTGKMEPVTFYISNGGANTSNLCINLFINMVTDYLLSKGPSEDKLGPYPVEFILDDFPRMPQLGCIADGITFGRSKYNIFLIVVQDWHQLISKYGETKTDVIMNSVGVKILKRLNNPTTRERFREGIPKWTRQIAGKLEGKVGYGPDHNPFYEKKGRKWHADTIISGGQFLGLALNKQNVLLTGNYHHPLLLDSPLYYKDEVLKKKAAIPPSAPIPDFILEEKQNKNQQTLDMQLDVLSGKN